ncbi:unnamed protein product [Periconia digitata]|uniref:Uncharacterized protein n=1 Tax=Periconia digitata TaxID=1303443 RepID=A0A9W4UAH0_9PLEO|nr:unnamed protein product [Periconia digitata]
MALPIANTKIATIIGGFLPLRSPNCPYKGWNTVLARRKAVATQVKLVPRLRACEIVGRAVLTTVPSRAESRSGRHIATNDGQNPAVRFHFWVVRDVLGSVSCFCASAQALAPSGGAGGELELSIEVRENGAGRDCGLLCEEVWAMRIDDILLCMSW